MKSTAITNLKDLLEEQKQESRKLEDKIKKLENDLVMKSNQVALYLLRGVNSKRQSTQQDGKLKASDLNVMNDINSKLRAVLSDVTTRNFELEKEIENLREFIKTKCQ
jgi:cell division protein FtsB